MDIKTAKSMIDFHLMDNELDGWTFKWDNAQRRAGLCSHTTRTISMSKPLAILADEAEVMDTILHEIAHALVGRGHGHDAVWRAKALAIGCNGRRTHDAPVPEGRWGAVCPSHGELGSRVRRPSARALAYSVCRKCNARVSWIDKHAVSV